MGFSAVGSSVFGSTGMTVTPQSLGDIAVVCNANTWQSTDNHYWGLSGGGVTTWNLLRNTPSNSSTAPFGVAIFWGIITSTGAQTLNNGGGSWSGCSMTYQEFSSTGSVQEDNGIGAFAISQGIATSGIYGNIVPSSINELFIGAFNDYSGVGVFDLTYSGFVYIGNGSTQLIYSLDVSYPNSYAPPWSMYSSDNYVIVCGCLTSPYSNIIMSP